MTGGQGEDFGPSCKAQSLLLSIYKLDACIIQLQSVLTSLPCKTPLVHTLLLSACQKDNRLCMYGAPRPCPQGAPTPCPVMHNHTEGTERAVVRTPPHLLAGVARFLAGLAGAMLHVLRRLLDGGKGGGDCDAGVWRQPRLGLRVCFAGL